MGHVLAFIAGAITFFLALAVIGLCLCLLTTRINDTEGQS